MNQTDEIRAACRTIIYLLDSRERWNEDLPGVNRGGVTDQDWREAYHQEAVKLLELLSDHAPTYWGEKAKDRREEFQAEDDMDRQRAYPRRGP